MSVPREPKLYFILFMLVALADAITTYAAVTSGVGYEANPIFKLIINTRPEGAFIVWLLQTPFYYFYSIRFYQILMGFGMREGRVGFYRRIYRAAVIFLLIERFYPVPNNIWVLVRGEGLLPLPFPYTS